MKIIIYLRVNNVEKVNILMEYKVMLNLLVMCVKILNELGGRVGF